MNISEQKKHLETNPKLDARLIAIAGENLGWELKQYTADALRFYIKPSLLGDGEMLTVKLNKNNSGAVAWQISSRTEMKVLPSFTKNWFNVKKMYEEIIMLLEYDSLDNQSSGLPTEYYTIPNQPWYTNIPWLSIIIVFIHGYIFWMFNQEVRDDAWQASRWELKDAGAFDRSLYYDGDWWHIFKSFFFDFRPGILYVSIMAVLALGYTIETTMPRWFLLLILVVSSMVGLFWAFDRTPGNIYDLSQTVFATMLGIYISGLLTRAIYFPMQRVVALAMFAYFGYWTMKSGYFPVVDKHVFMGSWLFGIMGGLCWYLPYNVAKIKKVLAPLSVFVVYIAMAFWVYKTVDHDHLCIESFKKMEENIDPYLPRYYDSRYTERIKLQRANTEKASIKLNELLTYKTSKSMWDVNISLQNYYKKLIEAYDSMIKKAEQYKAEQLRTDNNNRNTETITHNAVVADEPESVSSVQEEGLFKIDELFKIYKAYLDAVEIYWEKEHIRLPVITS